MPQCTSPSTATIKKKKKKKTNTVSARHQWLTPVIPAAQEAEIGRIAIQSQPTQRV
jgi:hypothetical protein